MPRKTDPHAEPVEARKTDMQLAGGPAGRFLHKLESRDPPINQRIVGRVDPGFRRDDILFLCASVVNLLLDLLLPPESFSTLSQSALPNRPLSPCSSARSFSSASV